MIRSNWLAPDGSQHAKNGLDYHWQQSRQYIQDGQYERAYFELYAIQSMIDTMLRELKQLQLEQMPEEEYQVKADAFIRFLDGFEVGEDVPLPFDPDDYPVV